MLFFVAYFLSTENISESENIFDDDSFIDLSKGKNFLGEIENQLGKLLND